MNVKLFEWNFRVNQRISVCLYYSVVKECVSILGLHALIKILIKYKKKQCSHFNTYKNLKLHVFILWNIFENYFKVKKKNNLIKWKDVDLTTSNFSLKYWYVSYYISNVQKFLIWKGKYIVLLPLAICSNMEKQIRSFILYEGTESSNKSTILLKIVGSCWKKEYTKLFLNRKCWTIFYAEIKIEYFPTDYIWYVVT